jgi:hypothetical protein
MCNATRKLIILIKIAGTTQADSHLESVEDERRPLSPWVIKICHLLTHMAWSKKDVQKVRRNQDLAL